MSIPNDILQYDDCLIGAKSVFKHLTQEELETLNFEKECLTLKKGRILYHEGNRMSGVYCVNKGVLKMFKTGIEGKEQIVRFAKKNDVIGYRSVLSNEQACTTVKVIEDADMCFIPSGTLITLVKNNPEFAMEIMQMACRELGAANSFITEIAQKTVRERLAEILILLKEEFGLNDENILQISLTREELANIVGTATESVIRLLSEFKDVKLIELKGRKIKMLNLDGLKKIGNIY